MTAREVGLVVPPAAGGILVHARSLVTRLPALGWGVRVCAPPAVLAQLAVSAQPAGDTQPAGDDLLAGHDGRLASGVLLVAVRWPTGPTHPLAAAAARGDLRRALRGVDAVSAQGLRAGAAVLAAGPATALVVTWHNPPPGAPRRGPGRPAVERAWGRATGLAVRRVARGAALTLAASADLLDIARAAGAGEARLLEVAAPATLPGDPARARAIREALGLDGRPLLLSVGRLAEQKDHATAVAAVARLAARTGRPPVLAIAGEGPERGRLIALAAGSGVALHLLGERRDVGDLLLAADVALICSRWEARSLYAQEALRAGVPLVATAVGGLPGLLGAAALLVPRTRGTGPSEPAVGEPPELPAAIAAALGRVLDDPALAARLSAAGRRRAAGWPDEDATARAVAAALERALGVA